MRRPTTINTPTTTATKTTRAVLLLLLAISAPVNADGLARGEIIDPVATLSDDNNETYALYLPSAYTTNRQWPILFVLDPRSQGRRAAELFQPGAERFGYILVSSNSTRSDSLAEEDPNPQAMVALLQDAMTRFAADEKRVYLTGFSGTSRYAWSVGFGLRGKITGVIGCGGALPGPFDRWRQVDFNFFGAAGETDFNHREMRLLDEDLDATAIAHRFEYFPGGHQWAPPEVLTEALGWMDVRAMKSGTRERQPELIAELFDEGTAAARQLESQGRLHAARRRWQQLAQDFDGLRDTTTAQTEAARLGGMSKVRREASTILDAASREADYRHHLDAVLNDVTNTSPLPPIAKVLARLKIPRLLAKAERDGLEGRSAQRQLETAFVNTAFYRPRALMRSSDFRRAILMLEIAATIKPEHWRPKISLATAYARSGKSAKAITALEQAVNAGYSNLDFIEQSSELESIRSEKGYQRIVERLQGQPADPSRR